MPTSPSDAELAARLASHTRFRQLLHLDACSSTQDVARDLPSGDAIVWSDCQSSGRGRQGRSWSGAPELDVEMTLRADHIHAPEPSFLAAALPTAVLLALESVADRSFDLKWPNDVLCDGRKLSGILIDAHGGSDDLTCLLGVGINANRTRFPAELCEIATSLALITGRETPREDVVVAVATAVDDALNAIVQGHTAELEQSFRERLGLVGRRVAIETAQGERVEAWLEHVDFRAARLNGGRTLPIATLRALRRAD